MTDTNPASSEEPALTPEDKLNNKRRNERIKLLATCFQNLALAIFGITFLRALLDPTAQQPANSIVGLSFGAVVAAEVMALYILGLMKAES